MYKRLATVILSLVLIVALAGCQRHEGKAADSVFYGTAEMEQINISSEAAGVIKEINISEGSKVSKGSIIAVLDASEAALRTLQAETGLELARNELQRVEDLNTSKATVKKAAELGIKQAEASYELAKLVMNKREIKAEAGGIVDSINYSPGEYVLPGSPIATLINPQNAWVKIYVPERVMAEVKLNQEVRLKNDFIDEEIKGIITSISSKAEFTPMNIVTKNDREKLVYAVKVKITNSLEKIKSGMLLDVYLY